MTGKGKNSLCIHEGEIKDTQFGGAVSPIFMASSYPFLDVDQNRYPRNFNTPNQEVVAKKVAALENAEAGLSFPGKQAATCRLFHDVESPEAYECQALVSTFRPGGTAGNRSLASDSIGCTTRKLDPTRLFWPGELWGVGKTAQGG